MIIHRIKAENFLKYHHLELADLPTEGLIAISGDNESGKSAIGETICFALFGRTFAVAPDNLDKFIRWGEMRASVELEFSARDNRRFVLTRLVDRDHNHSVRLAAADDPDQFIARGLESVAAALRESIGFDYEEYVEAFYLAQREITTAHSHSEAVRVMAGMAPMETCQREMKDEITLESEAIAGLEAEVKEVDQAIEELGYDEDRLPQLTHMDQVLKTQAALVEERLGALDATTVTYQKQEPTLRATEHSKRVASRFALLFLLIALAALVPWGLITYLPDSDITAQVAPLVEGRVQLPWLLYGGGASAVLFLLLWIRSGVMGGRIRGLRQAGRDLKAAWEALDGLDEGLRAHQEALADVVPERPTPEAGQRERDMELIASARASGDDVRHALGSDEAWLTRTAGRIAQRLEDVTTELEDARGVEAEYNRMQEIKQDLEDRIAGHHHRIRLREMADNLVEGALRQLSHTFTGNLRGLSGVTLPLFTEERYQHVMIDEDLTVRLFSNEKRDYMDMDEVSTGTQRQVLLALRLALAQELINRVVEGKQFVFLDEPFAFFDETRMRSALNVLPRLSQDIPQVWVTSQDFPAEVTFDRHVHLAHNADSYPDEPPRETHPALPPQEENP
ncbi:MAG: AAA family ATPase [Gammaproteobacteria bacterium]|nr:AAA family ATPase [Gammaproteobacteria bacterium]